MRASRFKKLFAKVCPFAELLHSLVWFVACKTYLSLSVQYFVASMYYLTRIYAGARLGRSRQTCQRAPRHAPNSPSILPPVKSPSQVPSAPHRLRTSHRAPCTPLFPKASRSGERCIGIFTLTPMRKDTSLTGSWIALFGQWPVIGDRLIGIVE